LLTKILGAIELPRERVFICNVVKCRPPENRLPQFDAIAACVPYLFRQIDIVKPKAILAMGGTAAQTLLNTKQSLGALRNLVHRLLFRSMIALTERGDVIDPVTLRGELLRRGDLDRAGGMEYLGSLIDVVPTAANVEYHAKIVRDKAVLRRLIEAATAIIQDAYEGRTTSIEVLDNAEHRVFQVAQFRRAEEFVRLKELIWPTMERIEQLHTNQGALTGVATGFTDLDRLTAGFQRGDLVIVAARPSMGKTAFALNVVQHAAIEHNVGIAVFSLEMSKEQLVQRLLCSEGLVDAQRLRRGQLRDDDYPKLARAAGLLGTAPIWIDDSAMLSPLAMRSKARRLKA